ncbi:PIN domain-containing protein [Massilia antarctica]|uniref:PIN domain-containing protein n=1 Tax=Massilia antarctica TaxID=2765360 RepID=UPI0006BB6571|nr:PIN domain-containing protein [Massilia sp. H27-R4]MCY0915764.1 PIN domain-containing protein [Massilia sp. H27-R4]CUI06192.1 corresponds to STY3844 from Accession AL513382: Salmonella typhi CT18 [Janthinobacterium sp. CG23_2]CUU29978.1 corresponds to STY3844 from Accession AL513382: Salmonella typhi CT18 [Janthinobacterium sp. CG23_2]
MAIALIDTNIVIDFFNGVPDARKELLYYTDIAISNITYMEFAIGFRRDVGKGTITTAEFADSMAKLAGLLVIQINQKITDKAIDIRANSILGPNRRIKLPDAIVLATAESEGRYMVTRDVMGYTSPLIRIPYQLSGEAVLDLKLPKPR